MGKKREQIKKYRSLGWLGKSAIVIGLIISLSSLGCGGSAPKTEGNAEKSSKQVQSESTKAKSPTKAKSSSQESDYAEAISLQASKWSTIVDALGNLIEDPHISDKDWVGQVKTQVALMRTLADEARKLSPPDKYKDVHAIYMNAVSEFAWVAENLTIAIDNLDANVLKECGQKMDNGSNYINDVGKAMDKLSK